MITYFGHPKAGSTWIGGLMAGICRAMGLKYFYGQLSLPSTNSEQLREEGYQALISQNSCYEKVEGLGPIRGFHMIRDPRDIIVSAYFSFLKTHPIGNDDYILKMRNKLQQVDKNVGLILAMNFQEREILAMKGWNYSNPSIMEVKYEDIIADPENEIKDIMRHLNILSVDTQAWRFAMTSYYNRGCLRLFASNMLQIRQTKLPESYLGSLINKLAFSRLAGKRLEGHEDQNSHYRKGVAGDWQNHFMEEHKEYFKKLFGDTLIDLGYEKDNNW